MIMTYEDYKKESQNLTIEQMASIHESMKSEIGDDPDAMDLYQELLEKSIEYCNIQATWYSMSRGERTMNDGIRAAKRDSMITHLNILVRYLRRQGHSASWRDEIAAEGEGADDKRLCDFGCYLSFISAINTR